MKKRRYIKTKPKVKRSVFFILFMMLIICIILNHTKTSNTNTILETSHQEVLEASKESAEETELQATDCEEIKIEIISNAEQNIKSFEDEKLKKVINTIQTQNNLTEDNFSFFYYNLDTGRILFL